MSQKPVPTAVTLGAGTYWLCTCGQSQKLPYCDGSHQGSPFQPLALELKTPKRVEIST